MTGTRDRSPGVSQATKEVTLRREAWRQGAGTGHTGVEEVRAMKRPGFWNASRACQLFSIMWGTVLISVVWMAYSTLVTTVQEHQHRLHEFMERKAMEQRRIGSTNATLAALGQVGESSERLSLTAKKSRYKEKLRSRAVKHKHRGFVQIGETVTVTSTAADREGLQREKEPVRLFGYMSTEKRGEESEPRPPLRLVSANKPVTSDVKGNLAPASVITRDDTVINQHMNGMGEAGDRNSIWLEERWQAALNMQGQPIPGRHWVEIDLQGDEIRSDSIRKVELHWESAFAAQFTLLGRSDDGEKWYKIADQRDVVDTVRKSQHVVMTLGNLPSSHPYLGKLPVQIGKHGQIRYLRLVLTKHGTRWGSSLWRVKVWAI